MGLLDGINSPTGPIATAMQSPLFNLGMGLIGGAQPFANPGQQMQAAAANQQQMAMQGYQLQMLQGQMPMYMDILKKLGAMMGTPQKGKGQKQPAQQAAAAPVAGPYSAAPAPQQVPPQAAPQQPGLMGPSAGVGGMSPQGLMSAGILASAVPLTAPLGKALMQGAQFGAQYDPGMATQMAAAKSAIAQDQALLAQAQQSGAPPNVLQGLQTKLMTDLGQLHIGSMSGILTRQNPDGSWTTIDPRTGLSTNTATGSRLLPGAAEAQAQMASAKEGAEEAARLQAQTAPAGTSQPTRPTPGAVSQPPMGAEALRTPNYIPPVLLAQSRLPQAPGNTGAAQLLSFQKEQAQKASQTADEYEEQATNAQSLITQANQIEATAKDFTPGRYAEVKGEIMAALQPTGILSPDQLKSLGSYQEGQKLSIQLQAMVTKQLGSREAAQVFSVMGKSIPNLTLSPDGLGKISAYLKGIAQYQIAQNTYAQRLSAQGNVAGVNSLSSNFQTYSNPVYYILASAPTSVAQELIANMPQAQRAKVQTGWKKAISAGLAPAPGDYD